MIPTLQQGQFGRKLLGLNSDPYFSSVVLLHNGTEANNATTLIDSSSYARTITTDGGAIATTTSPPNGATSSIAMDGTLDAYTLPTSTDFNLGSTFTVDFFLKPTSGAPGTIEVIGGIRDGATSDGLWFYRVSSGQIIVRITNGANTNGADSEPGVAVFASGVWSHMCVSGDGGSYYYLGVDGVILSRGTYTNPPGTSGSDRNWKGGSWNGEGAGTRNFHGNYGPSRVTKGVCRYSGIVGASYVIPLLPFPIHA